MDSRRPSHPRNTRQYYRECFTLHKRFRIYLFNFCCKQCNCLHLVGACRCKHYGRRRYNQHNREYGYCHKRQHLGNCIQCMPDICSKYARTFISVNGIAISKPRHKRKSGLPCPAGYLYRHPDKRRCISDLSVESERHHTVRKYRYVLLLSDSQ